MKYTVQKALSNYNFPHISVKFYYNLIWESDVPNGKFNESDTLIITLKIQLYRLLHHYYEMLNITPNMFLDNAFVPSIVERNMDLNSIYK